MMKQAWLVLTFLLLSMMANAEVQHLTNAELRLSLEAVTELREDPQGNLNIDEVANHQGYSPLLTAISDKRIVTPVWLRIHLRNLESSAIERWLEIKPGRFPEATLFIRHGEHWQRVEGGSDHPQHSQALPILATVFPLHLAAGETQTIYLRLVPTNRRSIHPILWQPLSFLAEEGQTRMIDASILGGLLVTAVLGLLLLYLLKDRAFAFNALATLSYCLGEASTKGYTMIYLWPEASYWNLRGLPIFALLGVGFNILFLRELLTARIRFPRLNRLLLALLTVQCLPGLGILFGNSRRWAHLSFSLHLPMTIALVLVGIYAISKRVHAARYYTAAYLVFAAGSLLQVLSINSQLSASFDSYLLPISMLLSNILMLTSVVDRIMVARREKEAAQEALLSIHTNHAEQLERAVEERTADLNSALAETRASNQVKSRLVAFVGHDLRTPLATIINYVRLLGRHLEPNARRYQATIEHSAVYQLKLIDELVEYARGELEHLELQPVPTYFYGWLEQVTEETELLAKQQGNRFILQADQALPAVLVFDPGRLRQIMLNLLGNAAKFTHDGEIRLLVHGEPSSTGEVSLTFIVEDGGQGISQEDMERVLQPFERGASAQEGFGLGLAIARQLVQAMDGDLKAESAQGRGSRFFFSLRLAIGKETDVVRSVDMLVAPEAIGTGKRVLVVNDHVARLEYLREILTAAEFDVVCETDASAALRLAAFVEFDLLLLDQMLRTMDAWEFMRQLDSHGVVPPPVIVCSARPVQRPPDYPDTIAFAATLLKPVAASRLLQAISELISSPPVSGAVKPQATMLETLRQMVEAGSISEIEDWAAALPATHPELSSFATRVQVAALSLDLPALTALSTDDGTQ